MSRKNRSAKSAPVHFFAGEAAAGFEGAKPAHEQIELLHVGGAGGELAEPLSKGFVERSVALAGHEPCTVDELFFGAEGDVSHTELVYTKIVLLHHSPIGDYPSA